MKMTYTRVGDYYIPNLKVEQEERSIGKWGRMHRDYLKEYHPIRFNQLVLSGKLWTHLADLNEQAQAAHGNPSLPDAGRRRRHRGLESHQSNGLGAAHEQYPGQGRRDRPR